MTRKSLEPGSFRDRHGRVFYHDGKVCRALSPTAARAWETLRQCRFFLDFSEQGKIVRTRESTLPPEEFQDVLPGCERVLEHDRIPFISYPYEWSFQMLRDAALLQLELLLAAIDEGMILKDATSYNVQWQGAKPVFIDVASFEPWQAGDPWVGYLQFCQLFLYPLMLTAYRDLPFAPFLRGSIDGIAPEDCRRILTLRDGFRAGVLTHVHLHAALQASHGGEEKSVRSDLRKAGFRREMIGANVSRLKKLVGKLEWRRSSSEWADYDETHSYDAEDRELKERFVRAAAESRRRRLAWDLGCNTGAFSRLLAESVDHVVAVDADPLAVDRLYRSLKAHGPSNVLPLVLNLADPSPALGWRHRERKAFTERERPELTICLAIIHHLVITANVPLPEFVDYLGDLGSDLVIEFVTKDDPRVRKLLLNKPDIYHDYEVGVFEQHLERRFEVLERQEVHSGTRLLYAARPK